MSAFSDWAKRADPRNINWKESVSLSGFARSSQGGDARRLWDEGSSYLTKQAQKRGVDKPGGDVKKQVTDVVADWAEKAEIGIFGARDKGGASSGEEDPDEPGTKATLAGRRSRLDQYSTANRRKTLLAMANPNKGKKHTLLTKTKGGR